MNARTQTAGMALVLLSLYSATSFGAAGSVTPNVITIPISMQSGFPVFKGHVDGHELLLSFDLGSDAPLALMPQAFEQIHPTTLEKNLDLSDVKGNTFQAPTFEIQRLELGGAVFHDIEGHVDVHDPSYPAQQGSEQGVVGEPLFRPYKVVFDYKHGVIKLIPAETASPENYGCKGSPVPFLSHWDGEAVTALATDLGSLTMAWDTGAKISVIRKARLDDSKNAPIGNIYTSKGSRLGTRHFGPISLRVLDFAQPEGIDGFLGNDFMSKHTVCIDFPGRRILIE